MGLWLIFGSMPLGVGVNSLTGVVLIAFRIVINCKNINELDATQQR